MTQRNEIPTASIADTALILSDVLIPTVAKGPIIRRPKMVALAERLNLDTRAVRRMQKLQQKYGAGPLRLRVPILSRAVVLASEHVNRVLDETPEPFATASDEKRAALSHFEPRNSLISHGPERAERRKLNEQVLETDNPVHTLAGSFLPVVQEEADVLLDAADRAGELAWGPFFDAWFRVVRRVVFGDAARDDHEVTDLVAQLRSDGNWLMFKPGNDEKRQRFYKALERLIATADPDSLGGKMRDMPVTGTMEPLQQVPQWLFAFDPAGMATFRALALLATHPEQMTKARRELTDDETNRRELPFLRACILESLRLFPTTPLVLRQSTSETTWASGTMPGKTGVIIFAPYFHRDNRSLPYADQFEPDLWLDGRRGDDWPLIPFSAGPAVCPGRWLVQLVTSAMLAALIDEREVRLTSSHRLGPDKPLPGTLDNYTVRFAISRTDG